MSKLIRDLRALCIKEQLELDIIFDNPFADCAITIVAKKNGKEVMRHITDAELDNEGHARLIAAHVLQCVDALNKTL